jgi:hypothetical protein
MAGGEQPAVQEGGRRGDLEGGRGDGPDDHGDGWGRSRCGCCVSWTLWVIS